MTRLIRVPLADATPLDQRVEQLCDIYYAAGYAVAAMTIVGSDLLLLLQKPLTFTGTN